MLCQNLNKEDPEPCNECPNCQAVLRDQCEAFSERDAASQGKIDHIRQLVEKLGFAVGNARMRIELFDEAHRIGDGAQDVLLKPLEEKQLVGMFCTTEPNKIKGTIRTRCEEYVIRKVTREEVLKRAKYVCAAERVEAEEDALLTIIDSSGGHIRDILNKMEMIAQIGAINVANTRDYLHLGSITLYYDILLSLVSDPAHALELVDQACENVSPDEVASGIAEAAMNSYRLANGMYAEFFNVDRNRGKQVYERYGLGTILLAEHFLENRHTTRVTLMRDILMPPNLSGNPAPQRTPSPVSLPNPVPVTPPSQVPDASPQAVPEAPRRDDPPHNFGPKFSTPPAPRGESHPIIYSPDKNRNLVAARWRSIFFSNEKEIQRIQSCRELKVRDKLPA
jgi:DNA polymerase III gamma/tau subunit